VNPGKKEIKKKLKEKSYKLTHKFLFILFNGCNVKIIEKKEK
jgi:hypothetical protein